MSTTRSAEPALLYSTIPASPPSGTTAAFAVSRPAGRFRFDVAGRGVKVR
ncbi:MULTISPECIES: hypothetical protein [Saccharothrix]|nr:hypothetical protein [Saccharothrix sp. CB00851]